MQVSSAKSAACDLFIYTCTFLVPPPPPQDKVVEPWVRIPPGGFADSGFLLRTRYKGIGSGPHWASDICTQVVQTNHGLT
jgi:hypothetical protein